MDNFPKTQNKEMTQGKNRIPEKQLLKNGISDKK